MNEEILSNKKKEAYYNLICFDNELYTGKENEKIYIEERKGGIKKFIYDGTTYTTIPKEIVTEDNIEKLIYVSYAMNITQKGDTENSIRASIEKKLKTVIGISDTDISELNFCTVDEEETEDKEGTEETKGAEEETKKVKTEEAKKPTGKEISISASDAKDIDSEIAKQVQEVKDQVKASLFGESNNSRNISGGYFDGDLHELNKEVKRIKKILKGKDGVNKKMTPNKRFSTKDVLLEKEKIYIGKGKYSGKTIELNIIMDCSASMTGTHALNSKSIIYIFNKLAKEGLVEGVVLFSYSKGYSGYKFPLDDKVIIDFPVDSGAEGFERTIEENLHILKGKKVLCLTDGLITDEPIDKERNTRFGLKTIGLYVGDKDTNEYSYLAKWFDYGITRTTLTGLVDYLIMKGLK